MSASRRIEHVLAVLEHIRECAPVSLEGVREARIEASKIVADRAGTNKKSVESQLTRELRHLDERTFGTREFDEMVWSWLSCGDRALQVRILRCTSVHDSQEDESAVADFFRRATSGPG